MKVAKTVGILSILAGIVLIVAGAVTWGMITSQLKDENITVPGDASAFAGQTVGGPFTAFVQAETINKHAMNITEGLTYAELGAKVNEAKAEAEAAEAAGDEAAATAATEAADAFQNQRNTVMNASFLRASLFTSVVSYGVAALVMGLGVLSILVGWALTTIRPAVAPARSDA